MYLKFRGESYFEHGFIRLNRLHNWSRGPISNPFLSPSDSVEDKLVRIILIV